VLFVVDYGNTWSRTGITSASISIRPGMARGAALGIPLRLGRGRRTDHSPSLDRIMPELGYVPENIVVVSNEASAMKNNFTVTELLKVARFYGRLTVEKLPTTIRMKGTVCSLCGRV
jgi:hypothetical protein